PASPSRASRPEGRCAITMEAETCLSLLRRTSDLLRCGRRRADCCRDATGDGSGGARPAAGLVLLPEIAADAVARAQRFPCRPRLGDGRVVEEVEGAVERQRV